MAKLEKIAKVLLFMLIHKITTHQFMRSIMRFQTIIPSAFIIQLMFLLTGTSLILAHDSALSDEEAEKIAVEAYIYGYPLITMEKTREVMTNVETQSDMRAPMGQFQNAKTYPDASFRDVTAPNADTLYSTAWLDLSKEPYVLHVPDENDRYYLMPMLSGWTNVFASPGTRTTGTQVADYVITGPNWKGNLPSGLKEIKAPTNLVWILGRTYCTGTPEDYKAVHAIQKQYSLTPLSSFGKDYHPPKGTLNPNIDMKTPVRDQVNKMPAAEFFKRLADLLKANPPAAEDAPIIAKMAKIGIIPGQDFNINNIDPKIVPYLEKAPQTGLKNIMDHAKSAGREVNGWITTKDTGKYGTNYLQRAYVAFFGLGANLPADAIYPAAEVDDTGKKLSGKNQYILHFPKGATPPAKGFWSLTMYNDQFFFVENPLNRFTLSPRNNLQYNPDGSLDLYIQHLSPGNDKEANWLPAPKDEFVLMLRIYWPEQSVIDGSWNPPGIHRTNNP